MGSHRKRTGKPQLDSPSARELPPWPDNIGKRRRFRSINDEIQHLRILDEIRRIQSTCPTKLIVFQKLVVEEQNAPEFRLGYYMIGVKAGARGRWVWGQFCLMIPATDLETILEEAKQRGWFRP